MGDGKLTTKEWLLALVEPGFILSKAMSYYIDTNMKAILRGQLLAPILRSQELRDEAFGKFWVAFSYSPPPQQTQTTGEVQYSTDLIPPILAQASGIVLDVGPGTGTQMPLLKSPAIKAIYGAEPCAGLHAELRKRAADEGLAEKYTILPCSVVQKELEGEMVKHGLLAGDAGGNEEGGKGVFDTIITVRVLCSVPDFERTAAELYALLKPGGKMLVVEHVVNPWMTPKGSILARAMQVVYHAFGWRWVMGDCCMNRDTEGVLRRVAEKDAGWESFEMERWFGTTCLPYVAGVLVKRK
ncbi:S-adenosyl-L-methionine-dependent methyltransferase [Aspergillus granulosus]|uniref:S-adenosyl-L-methionine-dependent methyltransferase n=1 Tax=Aspergillus granulosus TaxID=176169 RepID=A0ABR4HAT9_9EURO